ncbi:DUF3302 domain-containing protein, partial [Escherichia coli]|uniref:DUF3302 domain-containing protein n=1 Tax=Escherichia coli TaxID=562 RepID=UPI002023AC49
MVEAGTILCLNEGLGAVKALREQCPDKIIVADWKVADAIHVAGWVSLFTLHVIWPFLWIWATLYRPERGWGMQNHDS